MNSKYDGRHPEPPYQTPVSQDDYDALAAERDRLRDALNYLLSSVMFWADMGVNIEAKALDKARAALAGTTANETGGQP